MLLILNETGADLVATRVSEKVDGADMEKVLPLLESAMGKYGKAKWYYEMERLEGWTPKALLKDLSFDFTHASKFSKIAMVGDKHWEKTMTDLMKPFTSAEVKYFDLSEKESAMQWIKGN